MAVPAGLGQRDVAAFVKKCRDVQNTIPNAAKVAASKAGMAVKTAWLGVAQQQAGISPANKIARRKWNVGYDVKGGANATTLVSFRGPVHLVFNKTKNHLIVAKRLTTRSGANARAGKLGANAAFGGSNRGSFGKLRSATVNGRNGVRAFNGKQAMTIGGNLRAYAFHPGTSGKAGVWPEAKRLAVEIGPATYKAEYRKALIQAGFGAGKSVAGGLTK